MSTPEPSNLGSKQRDTLLRLFAHLSGHNIEWHDVLSLLGAVGSTDERHDGTVAVHLVYAGDTAVIDHRLHGHSCASIAHDEQHYPDVQILEHLCRCLRSCAAEKWLAEQRPLTRHPCAGDNLVFDVER